MRGESLVHFLPPRPEESRTLMPGWLAVAAKLSAAAAIDPVVRAGLLCFSFGFTRPLNDGNGRMHRLLIHHVLSRRGFTSADLIFPASAVMVRKGRE